MKTIEAYEAVDGKKFLNPENAKHHEQSVILETAKCRIYHKFYAALENIVEDDDGLSFLTDQLADVSDLADLSSLIVDIAKHDKAAFLILVDEIKKTNLKTYKKDLQYAKDEGWAEAEIDEVDEDAIEDEPAEAEIQEDEGRLQ